MQISARMLTEKDGDSAGAERCGRGMLGCGAQHCSWYSQGVSVLLKPASRFRGSILIVALRRFVSAQSFPYTAKSGRCLPSGCIVGRPHGGVVAIETDQSSSQLFKTDVLTATCGTKLDHGALAVGHGTECDADLFFPRFVKVRTMRSSEKVARDFRFSRFRIIAVQNLEHLSIRALQTSQSLYEVFVQSKSKIEDTCAMMCAKHLAVGTMLFSASVE